MRGNSIAVCWSGMNIMIIIVFVNVPEKRVRVCVCLIIIISSCLLGEKSFTKAAATSATVMRISY